MKLSTFRKFVLLIAFLLIGTNGLFAQSSSYTNVLTCDPVDLLVSKVLNATFEHRVSYDNTFTITGSYYKYSDNWSAFGIGGSYRWYIDLFKEGKKPLEGFSVGPMLRLSWWNWDGDNKYGHSYDGGTYVVIGGEAAYKWVFSEHWVVEPIIRLGFGVTDVTGLGYEGWGAGVNFGYTW